MEATMLVAGVNVLRVAIEGADDVTELRWISGHWISEANDLVEIEFRDEEIDRLTVN